MAGLPVVRRVARMGFWKCTCYTRAGIMIIKCMHQQVSVLGKKFHKPSNTNLTCWNREWARYQAQFSYLLELLSNFQCCFYSGWSQPRSGQNFGLKPSREGNNMLRFLGAKYFAIFQSHYTNKNAAPAQNSWYYWRKCWKNREQGDQN